MRWHQKTGPRIREENGGTPELFGAELQGGGVLFKDARFFRRVSTMPFIPIAPGNAEFVAEATFFEKFARTQKQQARNTRYLSASSDPARQHVLHAGKTKSR